MMRVMVVGNGESYHVGSFFQLACESLGIDYEFVNDWNFLREIADSIVHRLAYRLLKRPLTYVALNEAVITRAREFKPELVLITKGMFISPQTLEQIKHDSGAYLINFATDDPFNKVISSDDLLNGISYYDLYACTKRAIMADVLRAGCKRVEFVRFGYEPHMHYPEVPTNYKEQARFCSDVVFIGGADKDRVSIFRDIACMPKVCLRLYGGYWGRDPYLRKFNHGLAIGRDYRLALGGAKIAIGLVRRSNRDGHSMRTFEIPACHTFMLAERTEEHLELFEEDKEAAFFTSNEELVEKVTYYMTHDIERQRIAEAGHLRIKAGHHTYKDRLMEILQMVDAMR